MSHSGPLSDRALLVPTPTSLHAVRFWRGKARQPDEADQVLCPECGHPTRVHPRPEQTDVTTCAECVQEVERDEAEMCRVPYKRF